MKLYPSRWFFAALFWVLFFASPARLSPLRTTKRMSRSESKALIRTGSKRKRICVNLSGTTGAQGRAKLTLVAYSIERDRSELHFALDSDSEGAMQLTLNIVRELRSRDPRFRGKVEVVRTEFECGSLKRVDVPANLLRPLTRITPDAIRQPTTYRLHPLCNSKETIPTRW